MNEEGYLPTRKITSAKLKRAFLKDRSALSSSRYMNMGKSANFVVPQSPNHNKMGIIISPFPS